MSPISTACQGVFIPANAVRCLGIGMAIVLLSCTQPAGAQTVGPGSVAGPVNVPSGTTTVVGGTTITSTGTNAGTNATGSGTLLFDPTAGPSPGPISVQSANGNGLQAASGGTIFASIPGVTVQSGGGHAVLANGSGSSVTLGNGTSIGTTGVGSGLVALGAGAIVDATGVTVNNTGASSGGHGAVAEGGGIVNLHAGTTITTGAAFNSVGFGASGAGSQVNADALIPLTMNGRGAMGVYMHDGGLVSLLPGSILQLNGTSSVGVVVDNTTVAAGTLGDGLVINLNGTGVAGQAGSTGIYAVNGGNVSIADVTIQGQNAAAGAWAATGSTVTLSGSTIDISAEQNQAAYALATAFLVTADGPVSGIFSGAAATPIAGLFTLGGTINSIGTTINVTSNNNAAGVEVGNGGVVNMANTSITTSGTNSLGVRVDGGGQVIGSNSSIVSSGGAAVAFNSAPGSVSLTNTTVLGTGAGTEGMTALNFSPGGVNTFSMSGGSLVSQASTGMAVQGPINIGFSNGASATGGNGFVVAAFNNPGGFQQTNVQLSASTASTLLGHAFAQTNSVLDIDLATGSHWTGAAFDVTNVTADATSTWTITDDSTVTDTVTNAGLVEFVPPGAGPFHTLTTQSYVGSGGTLGINTFLGDDSSPSDILIIDGGTATGSSSLRVTNTVGPGALTVANGILVVDTVNGGTTQPGLFTLAGPVVAGPYEYLLFRGSVDASNTDAWFLRSVYICDIDPSAPICGPDTPHYRPETSLYAALPAMMLLYGRALLDTLHERVGQQGDVRAFSETAPNGAWGRIIGVHGNEDGDRLGIFGDGPKYDYDFWAFQAGNDLYRATSAAGARDRAGVFLAIGTARGDVTHFNGVNAGDDAFQGYSIGGYWTHFTPEDAYLDAVLVGTWYDAKGESTRLPALETDGLGLAASLEGGMPFRLAGGWIAEPQAQLVYQTINLDNSSDIGARVRFHDVDSLLGRLGVRIVQSWAMADVDLGAVNDQGRLTVWLRPNLWYEFLGDPKTTFSSADGFVPFRSELEGATLEINAGLTAEVSGATSVYANASYDIGLDGASNAYNGKIGLKVNW